MIRLVTGEEILSLECFCEGNPLGCKIVDLQRAHDLSLPFARFWVQTHEQGEITAAIPSLDGAVILHLKSMVDRDELKEFLSVVRCRTLLCEEGAAYALYGTSNRVGEMFVCSPVVEQSMAENGVKLLGGVPVRGLFSLLYECGEQKAEQSEPFYLDVSHRVCHGVCLTQGAISLNRLAVCAVAGGITETNAVLSVVAAYSDFRRGDLGGAVVWALLLHLLPRTAYVLCEDKQVGLFCRLLAFSSTGRWAELDFW